MKKTLLNILLAGSLAFGTTDKSKAQDFFNSDFVNNDSDDFPEEVFGVCEIGKNEEIQGGKGIIYYFDKDNDNFHEGIRETFLIKRCNNIKCRYSTYSIRIRELYISKSSGLIDVSYQKYFLNNSMYDKYFSGMSYKDVAKISSLPVKPFMEGSWKALTEQNIYETFGSPFGDRLRRKINGSQSKTKLMEVLKEEMID